MEKTIAEINAELQAQKAECLAHKNESERRHNEIFDKVLFLEEKVSEKIANLEKNKVSHKQFYWIIGTLISTLITIFIYMIGLINSIHTLSYENQKLTYATQKDVAVAANDISTIKKIFENSGIEFKP